MMDTIKLSFGKWFPDGTFGWSLFVARGFLGITLFWMNSGNCQMPVVIGINCSSTPRAVKKNGEENCKTDNHVPFHSFCFLRLFII